MVIGVVRSSIARTQQDGQGLVGGIEEAGQRREAIATLVVGPSPGLVRLGIDQGGVEVEDERPGAAHRTQPGRPGRFTSLRPGRSHGAESIGVDRIDHPAGRWRGRHGAEETRLIAQHRQVGETVAAVGQGERHVEQDPTRIVTPTPTHRRRQSITQCAGQAHEIGHLGQQSGARMGGHTLAIGGH